MSNLVQKNHKQPLMEGVASSATTTASDELKLKEIESKMIIRKEERKGLRLSNGSTLRRQEEEASQNSEESEEEKEERVLSHDQSKNEDFSDEDDLFQGEDGVANLPGEDYQPPEISLPPDAQPYGGLKLDSDTESDEDFEVDSNDDDSEEDSEEEYSQSEESPSPKRKKNSKKKKNAKKIVALPPPKLMMHVGNTQYDVVRFVGKKKYKMRLTHLDQEDWDLQWIDTNMTPDKLSKMKPYQKINHYPGMYGLARKNHLGRNLMKMKRLLPSEYRFFPQTWLLPSEYNDFKAQFNKKKAKTFILKPEASSQGNGIFLTRNIQDVDPNQHLVAQRYLARPFLIEGLKFDLRIYVLVFGVDPLRVFMFNQGLTRFATEPYQSPVQSNLKNLFMHLTNYAINKNNENFIFNETASDDDVGHKRSLSFTWRYLREQGHDVEKLKNQIHDIIIKTLCSVQPMLAHVYKSCQPDDHDNSMAFEILGFDVMLDRNLKPYLIEVNHSPSFTADTPLDKKIKKTLVSDTIRLCNFSLKKKMRWKNKQRIELQKRVLTGKKENITQEERERLRAKRQEKRDQYELSNLGNFTPIYLGKSDQRYDHFLKIAMKIWEDFTGAKKPYLPSPGKHITNAILQQSNITMGVRRMTAPKQESRCRQAPSRGVSEIKRISSKTYLNKQTKEKNNPDPTHMRKSSPLYSHHRDNSKKPDESSLENKSPPEVKYISQNQLPESKGMTSFYPYNPIESPSKQSIDNQSFTLNISPKNPDIGRKLPLPSSMLYKISQQLRFSAKSDFKALQNYKSGRASQFQSEKPPYLVTQATLQKRSTSGAGHVNERKSLQKRTEKEGSMKASKELIADHTAPSFYQPKSQKPESLPPPHPKARTKYENGKRYQANTISFMENSPYYQQSKAQAQAHTFYIMQQSIDKKYQDSISALGQPHPSDERNDEKWSSTVHGATKYTPSTGYSKTSTNPYEKEANHFYKGRYSGVQSSLSHRIRNTPGKTSFKGRQGYWASGTAQTQNSNFSGRISSKREVPPKEKNSVPQSELQLKLDNNVAYGKNQFLLTPQVIKAEGLSFQMKSYVGTAVQQDIVEFRQTEPTKVTENADNMSSVQSTVGPFLQAPSGKFVVPKVLDFSPRHHLILQGGGVSKPVNYMPYSLSKAKLKIGRSETLGVTRKTENRRKY